LKDSVGKGFGNPNHYFDFIREKSDNISNTQIIQDMIGRKIEITIPKAQRSKTLKVITFAEINKVDLVKERILIQAAGKVRGWLPLYEKDGVLSFRYAESLQKIQEVLVLLKSFSEEVLRDVTAFEEKNNLKE